MKLTNTFLQAIFTEDEFNIFSQIVEEVAESFPDVIGVMMIGSLAQNICLSPRNTISTEFMTPKELVYEKIRNRERKRSFPRLESDMDIWVCIQNPLNHLNIENEIIQRGKELIDWLALNPLLHQSAEWIEKKEQAFDHLYKQKEFYPESWLRVNGDEPWMAKNFKIEIEKRMLNELPQVVARVNTNFKKHIPGNFIEMRAYPECTFNLRPEDLVVDGMENRSPFPRIFNDDWISLERNVVVLYSDHRSTIYPFRRNGKKLGQEIQQYIWE